MLVDRSNQDIATLSSQCRNLENRTFPLHSANEVLHALFSQFDRQHVELIEDDPTRLGVQGRVVLLQFGDDGLGLLHRIDRFVERRKVDDMQQQVRALQMAEKLMTETRSLGRTLDQTWNVSDDKALFGGNTNDAEIGMKRRERILGHLGARVGDCADQGGLARIGHTEQTDVGEHTKLETNLALLSWPARRLLTWRSIGAALEVQVAESTIATFGNQHLLIR